MERKRRYSARLSYKIIFKLRAFINNYRFRDSNFKLFINRTVTILFYILEYH